MNAELLRKDGCLLVDTSEMTIEQLIAYLKSQDIWDEEFLDAIVIEELENAEEVLVDYQMYIADKYDEYIGLDEENY